MSGAGRPTDAAELLARVRDALGDRPPPSPLPSDGGRTNGEATRQAAVLVVLRVRGGRTELLLMRRAERADDPWSGQMSFPGGRRDPGDEDLRATALRETREEVGLDGRALAAPPLFVLARAPANRPSLQVAVFLAVLRDGEDPVLRAGPEAAEVLWVPLHELVPTQRDVPIPGRERPWRADGLVYDGRFVWGLTRRILEELDQALPDLLPFQGSRGEEGGGSAVKQSFKTHLK